MDRVPKETGKVTSCVTSFCLSYGVTLTGHGPGLAGFPSDSSSVEWGMLLSSTETVIQSSPGWLCFSISSKLWALPAHFAKLGPILQAHSHSQEQDCQLASGSASLAHHTNNAYQENRPVAGDTSSVGIHGCLPVMRSLIP